MVLIHLVVAVPYVGQVFGVDALAVVDDLHLDGAVLHRLAHQHHAVLAGVVDGVIDEIIEDLRHPQPVGHHHGVLPGLQRDGIAVMQHQLGVPPHNAPDHFGEVERLGVGGLRAALQPGKVQKVIDKVGQPVRLIDDDLHVFGGIFARQVPHDLGIAGDHRQRGAQVVAHIGDEFLPQVLHLAQFPAGVVQRVGKLGDLPVAAAGKVDVIIAGGQLLGAFGNADDGTGDHGGKQQHQQDGKRRHDDGDDDQLRPQGIHRSIDGGDGGIHHDHDRLGGVALPPRSEDAV